MDPADRASAKVPAKVAAEEAVKVKVVAAKAASRPKAAAAATRPRSARSTPTRRPARSGSASFAMKQDEKGAS